MTELIIWFSITAILCIVVAVFFIIGLLKRKRAYFILAALGLFLILISGGFTLYIILGKGYNKLSDAFKPRTGIEIYSAIFGESQTNCIEVINKQDQVIPKFDYAIWLEFKTCPVEMNRILKQQNYEVKRVSTKNWNTEGPLTHENWFKPESLGYTILTFNYQKDEFGNYQTIYSNLDTSKAYCIDVLD